MENRAHAIIALCFLVVFSAAAILIFYWLAAPESEPLVYEIVTSKSVGGLSAQSAVKFKGLDVGHVTTIKFDPEDRSKVILHLNLKKDTYVTHATYAVIAMQGLTGGSALELKLGKGSRQPLKTSEDHPARIPLHLGLIAKLKASVQQDMKDVHTVLDNASKMLDDTNREHVADALRQIDTITRKLVLIEAELMPTIEQLPALVENVQQSVKQSHALLDNANQLVREAQVPVRKAGELEDTIQDVAKSTEHLSRRLDSQTVPQVDALSKSLIRTSQQLDQLLRELKVKPQSLIFGPPEHPPGPGEPGFDAHAGDQQR
ncbi:MAG TPA: MlaD family protein [Rhodanobacteraceae bacterium]|nr:MlaD family protein [Rhodanobacteraceae bacterium]